MGSKVLTAGFTFVEVLLVLGVSSILLVGLTLLVRQSFSISREQAEQVATVEDARKELTRITTTLRNARDHLGESWLVAGGPYNIQFFTNVDSDSADEKVRYFIVGSDLKRGVINPVGGGYPPPQEQVTTVLKSIRNAEQGIPLFTYPGSGSDYVGINLVIDVNPAQLPSAVTVKTDTIVPRLPNVLTAH